MLYVVMSLVKLLWASKQRLITVMSCNVCGLAIKTNVVSCMMLLPLPFFAYRKQICAISKLRYSLPLLPRADPVPRRAPRQMHRNQQLQLVPVQASRKNRGLENRLHGISAIRAAAQNRENNGRELVSLG